MVAFYTVHHKWNRDARNWHIHDAQHHTWLVLQKQKSKQVLRLHQEPHWR